MEKIKTIHLEKPNTLSKFLSEKEQQEVVSLKITGLIGRKDFSDVLDGMCELEGEFDDDDNFIPDYEYTAAIRHLDLGEATYVDGNELPYFGYHTQLETLILPQGIMSPTDEDETGISESESITTLVLPQGLKMVKGFHSCPKLTGVVLPDGLEVISSYAFGGCKSITSIHIPASVKEMDGSCFSGCNIIAYEVDKNNPYYTEIDGVIYSKDLKSLVAFPSAHPVKQFIVPATTKIIGPHAFRDSQIESVELPQGLNSIECGAFEFSDICNINIPDSVHRIEEYAFSYCRGLKQTPQIKEYEDR
jgi:hypothetical protein